MRHWLVGAVVIIGTVAIALVVLRTRSQQAGVQYLTDEVRLGNLTVSVTATGALEPLTQVNVGTEVSGIVDRGRR